MPPPRSLLSAHGLDQRRSSRRLRRALRGRARNKAAAEHAGLPRRGIVEHAGLSRSDALFAGDQFDFIAALGGAQPGRLRHPGRAHAHEYLEATADGAIEFAVADPVDIAQRDAIHPQRLARTDHDALTGGIEPHHIKRRAGSNPQPAALADGEMHDALMGADDAAVAIDDVAVLPGDIVDL